MIEPGLYQIPKCRAQAVPLDKSADDILASIERFSHRTLDTQANVAKNFRI
jgi:hypothetical protein